MNQEKYEREIINELFDEMIDEVEFEKQWEAYKAGKSPIKIHIPTYAEMKDRLTEKTVTSRLEQIAARTVEIIEDLRRWSQMSFAPNLAATTTHGPDLTIPISLRGKEVPISFWKTAAGIEAFAPDTKVIGEVLKLITTDGIELKSEFFADDITLEEMKASAFFKKDEVLDFSQIVAAKFEE